MVIWNFSPFYQTLSPIRTTAPLANLQLQIHNIKEPSKGTSDHMMPLGNRFYSHVRKGSILFGHGGSCSIFPLTSTFMLTKAKFEPNIKFNRPQKLLDFSFFLVDFLPKYHDLLRILSQIIVKSEPLYDGLSGKTSAYSFFSLIFSILAHLFTFWVCSANKLQKKGDFDNTPSDVVFCRKSSQKKNPINIDLLRRK